MKKITGVLALVFFVTALTGTARAVPQGPAGKSAVKGAVHHKGAHAAGKERALSKTAAIPPPPAAAPAAKKPWWRFW